MELRKLKTFPIVIVWALIIVACNPATPTQAPTLIPTSIPTQVIENTATTSQSGLPQTEADVPRVSVEDTVAAIQSGEAIVVDVRSAQAYQASHIPGALSVPLFDIETDPASLKLDKDKWIITYCT